MAARISMLKTLGAAVGLLVGLGNLAMATATEPPGASARATLAVNANDFLDSIGACSAVSRRGENLAKSIDAVRFLGLRWLRVVHRESRV
jgi:hypothetical protein